MNEKQQELDQKLIEAGIKDLKTKKNILAYMEYVRRKSKEEWNLETVSAEAAKIEKSIGQLGEQVKANTVVYLKNELRNHLGKFMLKGPIEDNAFVIFFKQTYPERKRTKAFTFGLSDLNRLKIEQILETLKTINTYCLRNPLTSKEKADIEPMIQRIVDTQNVRLINQLRSMEGIRRIFKIKIIEDKNRFHVIKINQ